MTQSNAADKMKKFKAAIGRIDAASAQLQEEADEKKRAAQAAAARAGNIRREENEKEFKHAVSNLFKGVAENNHGEIAKLLTGNENKTNALRMRAPGLG